MTEIKNKSTKKLIKKIKDRLYAGEKIKRVDDTSSLTDITVSYRNLFNLPDCLNIEYLAHYPDKITVHAHYYGRYFIIYLMRQDEAKKGRDDN